MIFLISLYSFWQSHQIMAIKLSSTFNRQLTFEHSANRSVVTPTNFVSLSHNFIYRYEYISISLYLRSWVPYVLKSFFSNLYIYPIVTYRKIFFNATLVFLCLHFSQCILLNFYKCTVYLFNSMQYIK